MVKCPKCGKELSFIYHIKKELPDLERFLFKYCTCEYCDSEFTLTLGSKYILILLFVVPVILLYSILLNYNEVIYSPYIYPIIETLGRYGFLLALLPLASIGSYFLAYIWWRYLTKSRPPYPKREMGLLKPPNRST